MGSDVGEVVEGLPSARSMKVHSAMCLELLKLVNKVSKVVPEIEAARPRCSSGIDALCLLNNGFVKAKSLLQSCNESSVLYLALTGDAILSRCKKSRNLLEQNLCQLQNMVPIMLASKISAIISDLRGAVFCLDPHEEEAGKALRELLHRYESTIDSTEESALSALQFASFRLHLTSPKAIVVEKRSIRKLLDSLREGEKNKRKILLFFLNLLNKYGKLMRKDLNDHGSAGNGDLFSFASPYHLSGEMELRLDYRSNESGINMLSRPVPPAEFICPLSSRLMYDPVVIASGETYERTWIQRWFDEGQDMCPKTKKKLPNFSYTSNTAMKDLILKWCAVHSVSAPNPKIQEALLETSVNSIASLTSSMADLNLPLDYSNISLGSSHVSDLGNDAKIENDVESMHDIDADFLANFGSLPWDSQCNAVEDLKKLLKRDDRSLSVMPVGDVMQLLVRFVKDSIDLQDSEAQMTGCLVLLDFVQKHRNSISYMSEDAYYLLASFLDTNLAKLALSLLEALSVNQNSNSQIAKSGALIGMLNILDTQVEDLLEPALTVLCNLSSNNDFCSFIAPSDFIPKLIPLFEGSTFSRHCITILKNLSEYEDGRVSIAETNNCISSIVKLLENENPEIQEYAVSILLSLCSQRTQYCQLVMDEGVIPGLVSVCASGNEKAKIKAMELLRILKDEISTPEENSVSDFVPEECSAAKQHNDENPNKAPGLIRKLFGGKKKK